MPPFGHGRAASCSCSSRSSRRWIAPQNPYDLMQLDIMDAKLAARLGSMTAGRPTGSGTDGQGRDMLSAIIYGLRTALRSALVSGVVALGIGTSLGLVAAYYGGRVDTLIMRLVDLMLSFRPSWSR